MHSVEDLDRSDGGLRRETGFGGPWYHRAMVTPADRTSIRLVTEGSPDDLARVAGPLGRDAGSALGHALSTAGLAAGYPGLNP